MTCWMQTCPSGQLTYVMLQMHGMEAIAREHKGLSHVSQVLRHTATMPT